MNVLLTIDWQFTKIINRKTQVYMKKLIVKKRLKHLFVH